jgi:hypothetical protein
MNDLIGAVGEFGWIVFELRSGGYGAVKASALEAARPVLIRNGLQEAERHDLRHRQVEWSAFEDEVNATLAEEQADDGDEG